MSATRESSESKWTDLVNVVQGILMGGANIIPGVSGGTVALILGIFERLITAISRFDTTLLGHLRQKQWRQAAIHLDLRFVLGIGLGILLGTGGLATLMGYLLEYQLEPTLAVFLGLILASSVLVARTIERWDAVTVVLAVAGGVFAYWLVAQPFLSGREGNLYLFFCGVVSICAMILPGISGAFLLLILGKYKYITGVIEDLVHGHVTLEYVLVLAVFGLGCVVGLLAFSKLLRWLLARWHAQTMAVLCGFMIGSLRRIWPFKQVTPGETIDLKHGHYPNTLPEHFDGNVALALVLALLAVAFVFFLDWLSRRHTRDS
ncbi:MAG: DUF368 domain-containing protein [Pirellulales bacterium]|nr:DUF368 domain-containing protein [Pirellulales bacterium]